jgi:hypothetical protein
VIEGLARGALKRGTSRISTALDSRTVDIIRSSGCSAVFTRRNEIPKEKGRSIVEGVSQCSCAFEVYMKGKSLRSKRVLGNCQSQKRHNHHIEGMEMGILL